MELYYIRMVAVLFSYLFPLITGGIRYRLIDKGTKIIYLLTAISLLSECIAYYSAIRFRDNLAAYKIYSLIEILLISLYFNYTIDIFRRYAIGLMIGTFSVFVGIFTYALQSLAGIDSYFMGYTSVIAVLMSIISVFRISINKGGPPKIKTMPHFWFSIINLVYWSATFTIWILLEYYRNNRVASGQLIFTMLTVINILGNTAFGFVFFYYPKMIRNGR